MNRDYEEDLQTCKNMEGMFTSFGTWAANVLPWYIKRCMKLEKGIKEIKKTADQYLGD